METGPKRTVLVVDDDAGMRLLCRTNLEPSGFRVTEAADGDEAIQQIGADRPDVILLDVMMPRVSGWQVAAELLNSRTTDEIPIVFITALTRRSDRLRAAGLGAVAYLTKPFDPAALAPTLTALLDRIHQGERRFLVADSLERLRVELLGPPGGGPDSRTESRP